jgi:phenylacetate-CoA ligase
MVGGLPSARRQRELIVSGVYTRLCAGLLFPLHERLKGHDSVKMLDRLERSQWFDESQLEREQSVRLRDFLVSIGLRVPYYRDLFARLQFDPRSVDSAAALQALPLLGKPEIRAHLEALKAIDHGPLTRYNTGGSTGEPLIFYISRQRKSHDVAAKWRATRWWGVDIGDRELVVWGSPIELGAQDRLRRMRDGLLRSRLLPAFEMSEENLDAYVRDIRNARPAMLFGYPSSLALIARRATERRISLADLDIKVVFVTSEKLYPEQRSAIETAFGCPVANGYGARDAGFIAHECPQGQLHLSAEDIVVETILPDGRPAPVGEPGEIVVTHLATADFPMVRYRTGDVGVLGTTACSCGRGLPVLQEIHGRSTDFVVAADGTVMHGLALIYTMRDLPGVQQFRIEQISREAIVVNVVPGPAFDATSRARIVRDFKGRLGASVHVQVDEVGEIRPEKSGKYRYVVSRVKPFDAAVGRTPSA